MADPIRDANADVAAGADPEVTFWRKELEYSLKREKRWRKDAKEVVEIYEAEKFTETSFNILYSNTETLLPACYAQLPRPMVERRYKDADPLGKHSAECLERALSYLMDSADSEYDPFDKLMEQAVLGALVPGRGTTRFRYDPKFEDLQNPVDDADPEEEAGAAEAGEGGEEESTELFPTAKAGEKVVYETICGQDVEHDGMLLGFARRWVDVPWVAFSHQMNKEQLEDNFGKELAGKIPLEVNRKKEPDGWKKDDREEGDNRGSLPVADVWEIWDKGKKEVVFMAESYHDKLLRRVDDPYKLSGFYNCPEPLQFLLKRSTLIPTPMYKMYEQQAKELNRLSTRINRILNAMKVRGFYDGTLKDLKGLLQADDNTLLAAKDVAGLQDGKTLQNSIWLMPLGELVTVLQQLLLGREQCKQTIYEITGIADIMRGNTQASETATAQNIKNQWGTLRVKRIQRYVQRYVRDSLRIVGELAGKFFSLETFAGMTNLPYAFPQEVEQAKRTLMMVQQMQMQMQQMPQPGMAPAGPPQIPPQMQQAMQQAQATLAKPDWADVTGLLRSDVQRNYKIDIETNSTLDATTQEDKQNIIDAMSALANTAQSFGPMVQEGALPMPAFKEIMLAITRRFTFGRQLEEALEAIPDQLPQQGPDPKQLEKQAQDQQQHEQDLAKREQDLQTQQQAQQMAQQQQATESAAALKNIQDTATLKQRELDLATKEAVMSIREEMFKLEQDKMKAVGELDAKKNEIATAQMDGKAALQDERVKAGDERTAAGQQQAQSMMAGVEPLLKTVSDSHQLVAKAMEAMTKAHMAPREVSVGQRDPKTGRALSVVSKPQAGG